MNPDILINQEAKIKPITEIAKAWCIDSYIEQYGNYKAKIDYTKINNKPNAKLILVTAINPTPAGEGKTTTTIGLSDALNKMGKRSIVCLREPALGPVFGKKGGATGGGYSQVAPMEDINLHFTGDFAAVASAHNLLSALIDNHIYHGNALGITDVTWRRVIDMNDRSLRDKFDIVVASEVMAILCLIKNMDELKERLGDITIGFNNDVPITARDLNAQGAMAALLKDAIKPNLVQTLEGNPAIIHGGPFANIAHGCNSVIATELGMKLADYVITEAGFGSDLGMEKFIDIKCRSTGLKPNAVVLVATIQALKYNGDGNLTVGFGNLKRHINNVKMFNLPLVVCLNKFETDTSEELDLVVSLCNELNVKAVISTHWKNGSAGALDLAQSVLDNINDTEICYIYPENAHWTDKVKALCKNIYGIDTVCFDLNTQVKMRDIEESYPICVAKTHMSLTANPNLLGDSTQHLVWVKDVEVKTGARMIVIKLGDILTLPGLPPIPRAINIDVIDGKIIGLC